MRLMTAGTALGLGMAVLALAGSVARAASPPPGWPTGKAAAEPAPELKPGDVNGGTAGFTLGKEAVKLPLATGTITKSEGLYVVDLTFKDVEATSDNVATHEGKILRLGFAASAPGPAMMITTLVARSEGVLSVLRSKPPVKVAGVKSTGEGKCTVTITKLGEKTVEGTASCPSGMVNLDDIASPAISNVTFKATAL
jgi:hypothetical protein